MSFGSFNLPNDVNASQLPTKLRAAVPPHKRSTAANSDQ